MLSLAGLLLAIVALYLFGQKRDPDKILGVYTRAGKWYPLKYVVFLVMYLYRKYKLKHDSIDPKAIHTVVNYKTGININSPKDLEKAQPLSDHPKAFDAVFFIGSNNEGFYLVAGCERRQMGMCHSPIYLVIPGKGLLCAPKTPDTLLFGAKPNEFGAEGLSLTPVEPMKKWNVSYKGKMSYQSDPSKLVDVHIDAEWIAKWKYFNYDTDLCPFAVVRSIAREPWTKRYFENLKQVHQTHYEQFGMMYASFTVDGESYKIKLNAFRDHSFGHKRDWELMHRYAFHHVFLDDGTSFSVGVVCQPSTATNFEMGVLCYSNGSTKPVEWCDLILYQHGENGNAPKDYAFNFKAGECIYTVQVLVEHESVHYVGADWNARMVERFCKFVVNGIPGRGVSEFHYKHKDGRPEEYSKNDPIWYQKIQSRT